MLSSMEMWMGLVRVGDALERTEGEVLKPMTQADQLKIIIYIFDS
jgi:hypothetical protein